MKIILSRKGFDSSAGGVASPMFPDGSFVSAPIPDPNAPVAYREIRCPTGRMGPIVSGLTKGKITGKTRAHLDPDLIRGSLERPPGWRPLFGQSGAAQGHLLRMGVGPGDLFLFFGWFREVGFKKKKPIFLKGAPDRHCLYGWLQIGRIIDLNREAGKPWMRQHPHFYGQRGVHNMLYEAAHELYFPGGPSGIPGAGVFPKIVSSLVLTAPGMSRSHWRLPPWFHPEGRSSCLSYHRRPDRWEKGENCVFLKSAARGQDFVLDCEDYSEVYAWMGELFGSVAIEC